METLLCVGWQKHAISMYSNGKQIHFRAECCLKYPFYIKKKKKSFKQKSFRIQFPTQGSVDAYVYLSREWRQGSPKMALFGILEWESKFTLGLNAQKILIILKKKLQIKVVQNSISYRKLSGCMSITPRSGGRWLQILPYLKYWNGKVNSL